MAKGKNRKQFVAAGLLHEKAKLTKEQSAALDTLTPDEVAATIAVRNKLKGAFPAPVMGPIHNNGQLMQDTKPGGGPIHNNAALLQGAKPGPIQNNKKLQQGAKPGPIQNNRKLQQGAKPGPIQNNRKLQQAAKPAPAKKSKKSK